MKPGIAIVRVTGSFSASPDRVFDAWLDRRMAGKWLFATASRPMARVAIDARVGGSFCFVDRQDRGEIEHTGEYLQIDRPRRLVFTLAMENRSQVMTRATVEIVPLGTGCELTLTHENVPRDYARFTKNRWTGILYGLGVTLDSNNYGVPGAPPPRSRRKR